jgi:tRNA (guanine-N7-)-methyltransferase
MVRPCDLRPPFSKETPNTCIHDRVWYAQDTNNSSFQFPGWYSKDLFVRPGDIQVEYCSGNGTWIAEKALQFPEKNWIAVEKRFDRARKIWSKIKNLNITNLVVVWGEAYALSTRFFPTNSISSIFVNFPDPWPKRRHAKYRIISASFFEEAHRVLIPGGELIFVTDDIPYSEFFLKTASTQHRWKQTLGDPGYGTPPPGYGDSYFSSLFQSQSLPLRFHRFITI